MPRPTDYTPELAASICTKLAEGRSLRSICKEEAMPGASTVFRWLEEQEPFREQYARAREWQAESLLDEILEIADDSSHDTEYGESGPKPNSEWISRSRLRVDSRFKLMGQLAPKKYGKKLDLTSGGEKMPVATIEVIAPLTRSEGSSHA
jgi:hypothetical protein